MTFIILFFFPSTVLYFEILVTIWNAEKWSHTFRWKKNERVIILPHLGPTWSMSYIKGAKRTEWCVVVKTVYHHAGLM